MHKPNLSAMAKNVSLVLRKHSPEILTGIGIAGMISTVVMAVRATPKAINLIEERKKVKKKEPDSTALTDKLKPIEVVQTAWKPYVPAAITGTLSIACLVGASSVNLKRNAALATAYTLSESALKEYREKVIETVGEKKEQSIRDAVAKEQLEKNPVANREVIVTAPGDILCYDAAFGSYFPSTMEKIKQAVNELNRRMTYEMYVSLNDFYYELGIPRVGEGDNLGWNLDDGLIDIEFSTQLASDGRPCLVINYHIAPKYKFSELY